TAIPDPKSMSELPSTSTSTPPPAAVMNTGSTWLTPRATAAWRRASRSRDSGPGISVTRRRSCGSSGPPGDEGRTVMLLTIGQKPLFMPYGNPVERAVRDRAGHLAGGGMGIVGAEGVNWRLGGTTWQRGGTTNATYARPVTLTGRTASVVPLSKLATSFLTRGLTSPA